MSMSNPTYGDTNEVSGESNETGSGGIINELQKEVKELKQWKNAASAKMQSMKDEIEELRGAEGNSTDVEGRGNGSESASREQNERTEVIDLLARETDETLVGKGKSMHVRIASEIHRNRERLSESAPVGRVFNRGDSFKKLLEASLDTRIHWKQVHRAMAYLERESSRYEHKRNSRHGHILVSSSSAPQG